MALAERVGHGAAGGTLREAAVDADVVLLAVWPRSSAGAFVVGLWGAGEDPSGMLPPPAFAGGDPRRTSVSEG